MPDPQQIYNFLMAQKIIGEFGKRNIEGFYYETKEEALAKVLEMTPKGASVSCGGSKTLNEIGLRDALENGEYNFIDPKNGKNGAEMDRLAHEALSANYYFMSSNAVSATGELVNIDGIGNRTASLIYGPKNVIVIAGMNKVEPNLEAAIFRAKNYAAQMCLLAYKSDFAAFDEMEKAAENIGGQLVITSMTAIKGRIKVVLVGEDLGY